MFDKILDELIREDKLGETWRLELAPKIMLGIVFLLKKW